MQESVCCAPQLQSKPDNKRMMMVLVPLAYMCVCQPEYSTLVVAVP
jgi:hypothetical protein